MLEDKDSDDIEHNARKKRIHARNKAPHPHAHLRRLSSTSINPHAWGAYAILMYYAFFPLCLRAWEPFDCSGYAIGNNDTFYTMDADPTEQCYGADDSTYWIRMSPFAAVMGAFYTLAIPFLLGSTFARYHEAIEKDQVRAMEHETEGQSWRRDLAAKRLQANMRGMLTRRNYGAKSFFARHLKVHDTTIVRKHYGKLYEDFRPHLYWWRIVQMVRKVLLALCIFLPGTAPVFQATVAILILFLSFVAQVKYRPYLARPSHPLASHESRASRKEGGNIIGLFGGGGASKTNNTKVGVASRTPVNAGDDDDLARKRWKKAIMITRVEVRWHHRVQKHAKDGLAWLFDYNSLEMLALTCAIVMLLNGIMLETNSLRAPVLGVLKIASADVTRGFVRFVDSVNVFLFLLPCIIMPLSILVDIKRNVAFALHNRQAKAKRAEVAKMAKRAEAASREQRLSAVEEWRVVQKRKLDEQLAQLDTDHKALMQVRKEEYEDDRQEKDEDLHQLMKNRLAVSEFLKALRRATPVTALEAQKLAGDLSKTTAARDDCDRALLELEDDTNELDVTFREKSAQRQQRYLKRRQDLIDAFEEALRNQMEGATGDRKHGQGKQSGTLPVQLQMKVLVSQRQFDDKQKHITVVAARLEQMRGKLSPEALAELQELDELDNSHEEAEDDLAEEHAERDAEKNTELAILEASRQALFEKQKKGSDTIHQIDMAAEAHRRALEKQLSPEQYKIYMHAVALSRERKEKLAADEAALRKEGGLSADELAARVRALREAADSDISAYMTVMDKNKRDKHARLVARLAKIKEKEAKAIQEANMAQANGAGVSAEELEARVRKIQADAKADSAAVLADAGKKGSAVHDRLLKRLEAQKRKLAKKEAMVRMQAKLDGKSPADTAAAVDSARAADAAEEQSEVELVMVEESQERSAVLSTIASLKEEQGEQIYHLMKKQQSEGGAQMSADELSEAVNRLKEQSDARIQEMLASVGVVQDKKHRKMLEKIAERKAKQVARLDALKMKKAKAQAASASLSDIADVDAEISRETKEAAKDIADLTHAVADRHDKAHNKAQKRVMKLLDLASAHDEKIAEHDKFEEQRNALNVRALAIERAHAEETARMNARQALEREQASEQLQARLQKRRKKKMASLKHDAHARKKVCFVLFRVFL